MGVRGYGATRNQAFEQAGQALMQVILDPQQIEERESVEFQCEAPDDELLLVDWLNALIYAMATRHLLFRRFEVSGEGPRIQARAWGEVLDPARHRPAVEIKGATYTELYVGREADGRWRAQCVVDV
jgi:SHS2 domain-containing protein